MGKISEPCHHAQAFVLQRVEETCKEVAKELGRSALWVQKWAQHCGNDSGLKDQPCFE